MSNLEDEGPHGQLRAMIASMPYDSELRAALNSALEYGTSEEAESVVEQIRNAQEALPRFLESVRASGFSEEPELRNLGATGRSFGSSAFEHLGMGDGQDDVRWIWGGAGFWIRLALSSSEATHVTFVLGDIAEGVPEIRVRLNATSFLDFFTKNWTAVQLEELPENAQVDRLQDWWAVVKKAYGQARFQSQFELLRRKWSQFANRHCISGVLMSDGEIGFGDRNQTVWFMPDDESVRIEAPGCAKLSVPIVEWVDAVESTCELVVATGRVSNELVDAWRSRNTDESNIDRLRLYTGIEDEDQLRRMDRTVDASSIVRMIAHHSEIVALARMRPIGLMSEDLNLLFDKIEAIPSVRTEELDIVSKEASKELSFLLNSNEPAYEQGYAVGNWLRRYLNLDLNTDPQAVLVDWGIPVIYISLSTPNLDAIGIWGPRHGPAIILNRTGNHTRSPAGRRATLAHEICHLVVDRGSALPLVDLLGGRVDQKVERRARACAAELLVPHEVVYEGFLKTDRSMHEVMVLIQNLMSVYRVSRWVVAHQLENSLRRNSSELKGDMVPLMKYLHALTSPL